MINYHLTPLMNSKNETILLAELMKRFTCSPSLGMKVIDYNLPNSYCTFVYLKFPLLTNEVISVIHWFSTAERKIQLDFKSCTAAEDFHKKCFILMGEMSGYLIATLTICMTPSGPTNTPPGWGNMGKGMSECSIYCIQLHLYCPASGARSD